ncbi:MAG: hypothetical protein G01um101470_1068, partial [Parcubacteria group bacterium Gr01-1014_70]
LKPWVCAVITVVTMGYSLWLLCGAIEIKFLIAYIDLMFSLILSTAMWISALFANRHNPAQQNLAQKLKSAIFR